jgi:aminoglycoside/choline kinase family phosphotransferase/choline kinase
MSEPGPAIRGMILAAGYGTRLAPLTDHVPKPLLPVNGRTLLDHAIAALDRAGVRDVAVNTHHLGPLIGRHLAARPDASRFAIFHEPEILGTGGALDGARDFLAGGDHFLVHNGDVISDADLKALVDGHLRSGALATLLLADWPPVNSVAVTAEGAVARIGPALAGDDPAWRRLTYTGIGVFRREILQDIGPGFSSLIDPLVRAKDRQPGSVRGLAPDGLGWSDLGTPARYLAALDGDEEGGGEAGGHLQVRRLTGHGSDRRFWRLEGQGFSLVAMASPAEDPEFQRFVAVGRWLHERGLGAPALLNVSEQENTLVMQDVGRRSLYLLATSAGAAEAERDRAYEEVVDHLLLLQAATDRAAEECPLAVDRRLAHEDLRWETGYFRERFLQGHCGLAGQDLAGLDGEFEELARAVARQPLVLLHRDFQSQNIHLQDGAVKVLDFQGMRLGPLGYDIMSLVMDPYVDLPRHLRLRLRARFCRGAGSGHQPDALQAMALGAGLQRIMQALGAYGFLGHVKGKTHFLDHVPAALSGLRSLLDELQTAAEEATPETAPWLPAGGMPRLTALVRGL